MQRFLTFLFWVSLIVGFIPFVNALDSGWGNTPGGIIGSVAGWLAIPGIIWLIKTAHLKKSVVGTKQESVSKTSKGYFFKGFLHRDTRFGVVVPRTILEFIVALCLNIYYVIFCWLVYPFRPQNKESSNLEGSESSSLEDSESSSLEDSEPSVLETSEEEIQNTEMAIEKIKRARELKELGVISEDEFEEILRKHKGDATKGL